MLVSWHHECGTVILDPDWFLIISRPSSLLPTTDGMDRLTKTYQDSPHTRHYCSVILKLAWDGVVGNLFSGPSTTTFNPCYYYNWQPAIVTFNLSSHKLSSCSSSSIRASNGSRRFHNHGEGLEKKLSDLRHY